MTANEPHSGTDSHSPAFGQRRRLGLLLGLVWSTVFVCEWRIAVTVFAYV